jgi:predicted amino acid-binding ACT domain protein
LGALAAAGSKLEFVIARRAPEQPGKGVLFVTPLKGAKEVKAAEAAGFLMTGSLHSVRIEGTDKPGLGAKMTKALSDAGINLRGLSAAAIGTKFVCYLALDTAEDARKATDILRKLA